ncbi:MAG: urease accessory protein UreD [Rhodopseudomonas sp.]|uniref:urease accessory protein UreD n=1 Tax=Rhodopseudomonas sp. TaxID=1078 RepID=UPI0039E389DE
MQLVPPSCFAPDRARVSAARLAAEFAGGRTMLRRQQVGYPWHLGRGFHLDSAKPDLLTLYLQSASGGMYAGDELSFDVEVGTGAALHLTTQAATLVHACRDAAASLSQRVHVANGGFAALTNDPYILFPEAELSLATSAVVDSDGVLILADGFGAHRPARFEGTFKRFASELRVTRPDGSLLLLDRAALCGGDLGNPYDALGGAGAEGSVIVIAPAERLPAAEAIEAAAERAGCFAGVSAAPNDAGLVVRMTAPDGGGLTRGLTAAFHVIAETALGVSLAVRRK